MNLRDISIRKRINIGFTLIISISVLINLYLITEIRQISKNIDYLYQHPFIVSNTTRELKTDFLSLYFSIMQINASKDKKTLYTEKDNIDRLENDIQTSLITLNDRYLGSKGDLKGFSETFNKFKVLVNELMNDFSNNKWVAADSSVNNRLKAAIKNLSENNEVITQFSMNKGQSFHSESMTLQQKIIYNTFFLIAFSLLITILITYLIIRSISLPLKSIIEVTRQITLGNLQQHIEKIGNDEITILMTSVESMQENLLKNATIADKIAGGDFSGTLEPKSDRDELAKAINKMTKSLRRMTGENDRQAWLQQGQNELHEYMNGDQEMDALATKIITFICNYLNAKPGALYLLNTEDNAYHLISSYAYTFRKGVKNKFKPGEGLVGQAACRKPGYRR